MFSDFIKWLIEMFKAFSEVLGFIGLGGLVAAVYLVINAIIRKRLFLEHVFDLMNNDIKNWKRKFNLYEKPILLVKRRGTEAEYSFSKYKKEILKKNRCIFIHSPSGYGKSMLMLHLAYACAHKLIIKKIDSEKDFGLLYIKVNSMFSLEDIKKKMKNLHNISVFIDGLDEMKDFVSSDSESIPEPSEIIREIISIASIEEAKRLVISFRSELFADYMTELSTYKFGYGENSKVIITRLRKFSNQKVIRTYKRYSSEIELCRVIESDDAAEKKLSRKEKKEIESRLSEFLDENEDSLFSIPLFVPWVPLVFSKYKDNKEISALSKYDILQEITYNFFRRELNAQDGIQEKEGKNTIADFQKKIFEIVKKMNRDVITHTGIQIHTDLLADAIDSKKKEYRYSGKYLFRYTDSSDENPCFEFLHSAFYEFYLCSMIIDEIKNYGSDEEILRYYSFISNLTDRHNTLKELYYQAVYSELKVFTKYSDYRGFLNDVLGGKKLSLDNCTLKLDRVLLMLPCLEELSYNGTEIDEDMISSLIDKEIMVDTKNPYTPNILERISEDYIKNLYITNRNFIDDALFNTLIDRIRPLRLSVYTDNQDTFYKLLELGADEIRLGLADYSGLYIDIYNYIRSGDGKPQISLLKATKSDNQKNKQSSKELLRAVFVLDYVNFQRRIAKINNSLVRIFLELLIRIFDEEDFYYLSADETEANDFVETIQANIFGTVSEQACYGWGMINYKQKKYASALPFLEFAYKCCRKHESEELLENRERWYGHCLYELKRYVEALPLFKESYEWCRKHGSEELLENREHWYGLCLYELKLYAEALPLFKESYEWCREHGNEAVTLDREWWYGFCLCDLNRYKEALPHLEASYNLEKERRGEDAASKMTYTYGVCLFELGRYEEALPHLKNAFEYCKKFMNKDVIEDRKSWYERCLRELGKL